jgi:transcriptional regulator with XRE-family HTH domain
MNAHSAEFAIFLKTLRRCIPPDAATLGPWKRLPVRCGRRVTQEEVAEAVGVSRNWYRRLESGATVRASPKLLDRLATALAIRPGERTQLFVLGIPEMQIQLTRHDPAAEHTFFRTSMQSMPRASRLESIP